MSYQLTPADVWSGLNAAGKNKEADQMKALTEVLLDHFARILAEELGVKCGEALMEEQAFAGLLIPFFPSIKGQSIPEAIEGCDDEGKWDPD